MTPIKLTLSTLLVAAMAGCSNAPAPVAAPAPTAPAAAAAASTTTAQTAPAFPVVLTPLEKFLTVVGKLAVVDTTGYRLTAVKEAYNLADIHHVTLTLYVLDGSTYVATGASKTLTCAGSASTNPTVNPLYAPVSLHTLKYDHSYKIVATAFADSAGTDRIDTANSACETTFTTDAVSLGTQVDSDAADSVEEAYSINSGKINLRLKNKTFAGTAAATSGTTITNGKIDNPTAGEGFN